MFFDGYIDDITSAANIFKANLNLRFCLREQLCKFSGSFMPIISAKISSSREAIDDIKLAFYIIFVCSLGAGRKKREGGGGAMQHIDECCCLVFLTNFVLFI